MDIGEEKEPYCCCHFWTLQYITRLFLSPPNRFIAVLTTILIRLRDHRIPSAILIRGLVLYLLLRPNTITRGFTFRVVLFACVFPLLVSDIVTQQPSGSAAAVP